MPSMPSPSSPEQELIIFHQPVPFAFNLNNCKTVGDLVCRLNKDNKKPSSLNLDDGSNYFISGIGTSNIPLNGDKYDPRATLPLVKGKPLEIVSKAKQHISITVQRTGMVYQQSKPKVFEFAVGQFDKVSQIGQKIENETGVCMQKQRLLFNGSLLLMQDCLLQRHIHEKSVIDVSFYVILKFNHNNETESHSALSDAFLPDVLLSFIKRKGVVPDNLQFGILKATGRVKQPVADWLPTPSTLFSADSAEGTLEENGLLDMSELQVYSVLPKRKRAGDGNVEVDHSAKRRKVGGTAKP